MARSWMWALAIALCLAQTAALAQSWPSKPVRVIVPFTAGSATDIMTRTVSQRLAEQLGQVFVVENRPGAGGTIGVAAVAKAEPDGNTMLVHSSSYTITPSTYPNAPYDTLRDLTGITPLAFLPQVLVIAPGKRISSVQDLVRAAKAKRRHRRRPRALQGNAGGLDGNHRRPGRLLFLSGQCRVADDREWNAYRTGNGKLAALGGAAGPADDDRGRNSQFGL